MTLRPTARGPLPARARECCRHHTGHGGTACIFGCSWCTRHKDLKHIIRADCDENDQTVQASLGCARSFAQTVEWMEEFEQDLRTEMTDKKEKYMETLGNSKELYDAWCKVNLGHLVDHPVRCAKVD